MLRFVRIHNVSSTVMSTFHYDFFQRQCKTFSFNMRMFLSNFCNQKVLQTVYGVTFELLYFDTEVRTSLAIRCYVNELGIPNNLGISLST